MAQVKKKEKRNAILKSASRLFRENGFLGCRMEAIASDAGTAVANLYVYFPSKLHLFYDVWTPLIEARMLKLAEDARQIDDSRQRLRFIFLSLWRDMPREDNQFAKNLMEAIITAPDSVEKPHDILKWCEDFLNELIGECLPADRKFLVADSKLSFLSWMAFDGFVVNVGKRESSKRNIELLINHFADLLLYGEYRGLTAVADSNS
ncbi:TetR/AcrR family transcriptional regulator [Elongatibacter sediminis]|uniref:TetR/AcrR family transcriptional regulator n=1 Tax=Elongatibacter sediminis TaxID=3119006 RepID=A0AAW9RNN7_9GAMM